MTWSLHLFPLFHLFHLYNTILRSLFAIRFFLLRNYFHLVIFLLEFLRFCSQIKLIITEKVFENYLVERISLIPFSIGKCWLQIATNISKFDNSIGGFLNGPMELTDFCRFVANICQWKTALRIDNPEK